MKWIVSAILILLLVVNAKGQTKVANYGVSKPGTDKYEHLSFWIEEGKRANIYYAYGKDRKEMKLQYLGVARMGKRSGFKLQFPNGFTVIVFAKNSLLLVRDFKGKYNKTFTWEYEGPVNGIGTFCDVCTEDEKEAMQLLKSHYLK